MTVNDQSSQCTIPRHLRLWAQEALGKEFDEIVIHPQSGRNSLWVCKSNGDEWLIKATLAREVANVALAASVAAAPTADDAGLGLLLYPMSAGLTSLEDIRAEQPDKVLSVLAELGPKLRELHQVIPPRDYVTAVAPWPELDPVPMDAWLAMSPAARALVKKVQARPHLSAQLNKLSKSSGTCMVHGDIKPDNIIIQSDGTTTLIDWELGGRGDPCLDVASVLGSMLFVWASGLALSASSSVEEWEAGADVPFSAVRREANNFLGSYGVHFDKRGHYWTAAAAWLGGRCWADAMHARELSASTLVMVAVASRIARKTAEYV